MDFDESNAHKKKNSGDVAKLLKMIKLVPEVTDILARKAIEENLDPIDCIELLARVSKRMLMDVHNALVETADDPVAEKSDRDQYIRDLLSDSFKVMIEALAETNNTAFAVDRLVQAVKGPNSKEPFKETNPNLSSKDKSEDIFGQTITLDIPSKKE